MDKDFEQIAWDDALAEDCRRIVRLAVHEDLERVYDWTTVALVSETTCGDARVVARRSGIVAGLAAGQIVAEEYDRYLCWEPTVEDGAHVVAGQPIARLHGLARSMLAAERTMLNLLGHMCGIATLTRQYVDAVTGTTARVYDTRKTMLGVRRLAKYAVRCGGGHNHRHGLYDAVLIKDNHLALGAVEHQHDRYTPAQAVAEVREFLSMLEPHDPRGHMIVEVEVDSLEQLREVLPAGPDLVLLDNMPPDQLRQAIAMRDELASPAELEASGGVTLDTIAAIARTGVERISVGALTHSAPWFDLGLDWAQ